MKIVIQDGAGANHFIRLGLANAFGQLGNQVFLWDSSNKSAFDMFTEFDGLDLFITGSYQLDRPIMKNLLAHPNLKTCLYLPNFGDSDSEVPPEYPLLFATDQEKQYVEQLVKNGNLQWGFGQYHQDYLNITHNKWLDLGIKIFSLMPALDTVDFYPVLPQEKYKSDIFYVGGYWGFKSGSIQKYLLSLAYPNTKLNLKIFGNGFPIPQAMSPIPTELMKHFYSSAKISLNLFEPHSTDFNRINFQDLNQRLFQINGCISFQLSEKFIGVEKIFNTDEIVTFSNIEEYKEKLICYLDNPLSRLPFIDKGSTRTWKEHTFLHRISIMLEKLEYVEELQKAKKIISINYENFLKNKNDLLNKMRDFYG